MAIKIVELQGIGIVRLQKRRGTRNMRISMSPEGEVRVGLPAWAPYQGAIAFAMKHRAWIEKHRPVHSARLLQDGDRIGKAHRINLLLSPEKLAKPRVTIVSGDIRVHASALAASSSPQVQSAMRRGAIKALAKEAGTLLPQRLATLSARVGLHYKSIKVKSLKSRWGSCDQSGNITLNIYLMQLPWHLIDYVIVHELVHTEHPNHSADFWQRFEHALPEPKKLRRELKKYNPAVVASGVVPVS